MDKKEFNDLLKKAGLTKKDFSTISKVPYNTITGWGSPQKPIPNWVKPFIENYIKAKRFETAKKALCDEPVKGDDE